MEPDLYTWPLIMANEDCFVPSSFSLVLEVAAEWDSEVCGLVLSFAGMKAREQVNVN